MTKTIVTPLRLFIKTSYLSTSGTKPLHHQTDFLHLITLGMRNTRYIYIFDTKGFVTCRTGEMYVWRMMMIVVAFTTAIELRSTTIINLMQ